MLKSIIMSAAILLAMFAGAENRIYQGNYATGIAKWTVKSNKLYEGRYATGIAKWTLGESSGVVKIFQGNYATGIAKFCFKGNKLYEGNYATGIAKWTISKTDSLLKIFQGNYATGIAKFCFKSNKLYAGNYATGIAKWTFSATDEIPDALLVFLATQILVEESVPTTDPTPVVDPTPIVDPKPFKPSRPTDEPSYPVDLSLWRRARSIRGAVESNGRLMAVVEVKCGKMDRRGIARVSAKVTPLVGSKRSYRSQRVLLRRQNTQSVVWNNLRLDITGDEIAGQESSLPIRNAAVGGDLRDGSYAFSAVGGAVPASAKGYAVLPELFPTSCRFSVVRNRWNFPKAKEDPAAVKISYSAKTGIFKGTFKAFQSNEGYTSGRVRTKKTSVKVMGFVVDGKGEGNATAKKPQLAFEVAVSPN